MADRLNVKVFLGYIAEDVADNSLFVAVPGVDANGGPAPMIQYANMRMEQFQQFQDAFVKAGQNVGAALVGLGNAAEELKKTTGKRPG